MSFRMLRVSMALAFGCAGMASAQTMTPPAHGVSQDATAVEDVVVVGATRRAIGTYARTIGSGPAGRLSPRWNDRLCVRIIGMDAEHAVYLRDRIETVARAIGLSPDPSPACGPNISIYASDHPDALASTLIEAAPGSFRPARQNVTLGDAALETFRTTNAPIRWWQVSLPLMVDTGLPAIALGGGESRDPMARSVAIRNGSRLAGNVRDDLLGVTIIIDTQQVNSAPFEAVGDYVAFVALAPADPRVATADLDTVLNLFARPGVAGLTPMDQDYLLALYTASRAPASAALQASEIADRMMTERRRRSAAPD